MYLNTPKGYTVKYPTSNFKQVIKVVGVGGGGSNAVNHMMQSGFEDVGYVVCNTDAQALEKMDEKAKKVQLGLQLTKGLGAGTNPEIGEKAAIESEAAIKELLSDKTEMVFITAGMGGGTGTGAAPIIAKIAKEMGLLVVAVVSDPFKFEGHKKIKQANEGIDKLRKHADTVLVIKNTLLQELYKDLSVKSAYKKADEVLANGVKSIAELITSAGEINCDFADVKMVLEDAGQAMMGSALAKGENRAINAIRLALESPLLENNKIVGAQRVLMSIAYSDEKPEYEITMNDQTLITDFIQNEIGNDAEVFKHGYSIDRTLGEYVRVTIVAAGIDATFTLKKAEMVVELKEQLSKEAEKAENTAEEEVFEKEEKQLHNLKEKRRIENEALIEFFRKNDFKKQSLTEVPSYTRLGKKIISRRELDERKVERFPLFVMYEALKKEGLLKV